MLHKVYAAFSFKEGCTMYRPYSELKAETAAIKQIDIQMVAEEMGFTFKRRGSHLECREIPGMVIFLETNTYHNFYTGKSGSVIDLVMEYEYKTFPEAIRELSKYLSGSHQQMNKYQSKSESKPFRLPPINKDYRRVFAYLNQTRGIDSELIAKLMHEHRIYEEANHHNAVFLAGDRKGFIQHAFIRGTITGKQFRGDVEGSNKDYGFNIEGTSDRLVVFEAPIDLLSYKTLYKESPDHLLALGMLAESPVYTYLAEYPEVKRLLFILDNDKKGREAARRYEREFADHGYEINHDEINVKMWYAETKDVNDYLLAVKQQRLPKQSKQACRRC